MVEVCLKFEPAIHKIANKFKENKAGLEKDDLVQIAYLGLIKGYNSFNENKANYKHSFNTHIFNNIIWSIKNEIIRGAKKYNYGNTVSLEAPISSTDDDICIADTIESDINLFRTVMDAIDTEEYITEIRKVLNEKEANTMIDYIFNYSTVDDLAIRHNISNVEMNTLLYRYKQKLRNVPKFKKIYSEMLDLRIQNISEMSLAAERIALEKIALEQLQLELLELAI